jgi:hypothetical protein
VRWSGPRTFSVGQAGGVQRTLAAVRGRVEMLRVVLAKLAALSAAWPWTVIEAGSVDTSSVWNWTQAS